MTLVSPELLEGGVGVEGERQNNATGTKHNSACSAVHCGLHASGAVAALDLTCYWTDSTIRCFAASRV